VIISFAWTTPALLAGEKTMTRRKWSAQHAAHFKSGMLVDAWDRSPRTGKGRKVATIRLTRDPYLEVLDGPIPSEVYRREGFAYLATHGQRELVERICSDWVGSGDVEWVVEFELVERVA
jgi:hypothetical protein